MEDELINKYFRNPQLNETAEDLTATEIKVYLELKTNQRLILDRIGKSLKKLNFQVHRIRRGDRIHQCWQVIKTEIGGQGSDEVEEDLPF